jgi:hypothetical protein
MKFKVVQIEGQVLFKDKTQKMQKYGGIIFKNLLKNHKTRNGQIYMKAFLHIAKSCLFKSWSSGLEGATIGKSIFACVYSLKNLLQFQSNLKHEGNSSVFK